MFDWVVDFVGENHDRVLVSHLYYGLDVVSSHHVSSWVAWIDDHNSPDIDSQVLGVDDSLLDVFSIHAPILVFVEKVFDHGAAIKSQQGRVQRVLRDRHHDTV